MKGIRRGRENRYLIGHRAHDYHHLLCAWRHVAAEAGARIEVFAEVGGYPLIVVEAGGDSPGPGMYVSAGIHGDEPAGVWGLVEWARQRLGRLRMGRLVVFPCLNPHGLDRNTRLDEAGRDLNRMFDVLRPPPVLRGWHRWMEESAVKVAVSVCLHEDYDSQGTYCYELYRRGRPLYGRRLLDYCAREIPVEGRASIEGRKAEQGWIKRASAPKMEGVPEAFPLYAKYSVNSMTFETPSEFSLYRRVRAHALFLRQLERVMGEEEL